MLWYWPIGFAQGEAISTSHVLYSVIDIAQGEVISICSYVDEHGEVVVHCALFIRSSVSFMSHNSDSRRYSCNRIRSVTYAH